MLRRVRSTNCIEESKISKGAFRGPKSPRPKENKKKWTCVDVNGNRLTGGGIVPYDENGIWIIKEVSGSRESHTDVGGKWRFEDIDINGCITREWNEETYFTAELKKSELEDLLTKPLTSYVYVNDHQRNPTYVAYVIHVNDLTSINGFDLNPDKFEQARQRAIKLNPSVPQEYYSSVKLEYISYNDLKDAFDPTKSTELTIGYRLRRILLHGSLKQTIQNST